MKNMLRPVMAMLLALPTAHAQDLLQGLLSSQSDPSSQSSSSSSRGGTPTQVVTPTVGSVTSTASTQNCPSSGQTDVPLKYVAALLRTKGASLQLSHDVAQNRLNIRGGEFLSNCNGMLEWGLRAQTQDFPQYVVELKVKSCGGGTCPYKVMTVNDAGEQVEKEINVKPDFAGFQQCLKETGVVNDKGGIETKKMVVRDLEVSFDGVENSGPVWFGSHLPGASALYKKQQEKDCYYMEDIRQGGYSVYSSEDSERMRLDEQAQIVCDSGNYRHIADFMERYGQYAGMLGSIRDELILKDYKDLAAKIAKGEGLETMDYSVVNDFQKFIIDPLVTKITQLHEKIGGMPTGSQERRAKEQELQALMKQLASYKQSPFITDKDLDKLMAKGLFDEAANINGIHLTVQNYGRLGANESGTVITPKVARQRILDGKQAFQRNLVTRKEQYEVQTGRLTGKSEYYSGLAAQHRRNIQTRTSNYQTEINNEVARITSPSGYCYKYFRNTQKCIQDSAQRIQDLRNQLQQYNQADANIATELEQKANQYKTWENEGQRYIAAQNGEQPTTTAETKPSDAPQGPSVTAPQADRSGEQQQQQQTYQFQLPQTATGQQQQGQMVNPYMTQMPTQMQGVMAGQQYNPYMQNMSTGLYGNAMMGASWGNTQYSNPYAAYSSPYMGYGLQNGGQGYTFNYGTAMGYQNPYSSYGMMGYSGNIWSGAQNPYSMMGGYTGSTGYMQSPMMYNSGFSNGLGAGLTYYR